MVLPGIVEQVIEGTIIDPSIPPWMSHGSHGPPQPPRKLCCPPHPRKGVVVKGKKVLGVGLGSVCSVVSVAIHPGRGVCRDGLRLSRWRDLLPDGNVLPRKYRMNLKNPPEMPMHVDREGPPSVPQAARRLDSKQVEYELCGDAD